MKKFFGFFRSVLGSFNKYLVVCLVCLLCYSFSSVSAYTTYVDCGGNGYNDNICIEFNPNEYYTLNNNVNMIMPNWQFNYFGDQNYKTNYSYYEYKSNQQESFLFWYNGNLLSVLDGNYKNNVKAYSIDKVCMYNGTDNDGIFNKCMVSTIGHRCTDQDYINSYNVNFSDFKSSVNGYSPSKFVVLSYNRSYNGFEGPVICGTYGNITYCINKFGFDYTNDFCTGAYTLYDSGSVVPGTAFEYYSQYFQNSPLTAGSTNYPIIGYDSGTVVSTGSTSQGDNTIVVVGNGGISNSSVLNYYNNNGYDYRYMCYGGYLSGDSKKDIFSIFHDLYGTGLSDNDLVFLLERRRQAFYRCQGNFNSSGCALNGIDSSLFNLIINISTKYMNYSSANIVDYCNLYLNMGVDQGGGNTSSNPPIQGSSGYSSSVSGTTALRDGVLENLQNGDYTNVNVDPSSYVYSGITILIPTNDGSGTLDDFVGDIDLQDTSIGSIFNKLYSFLDNYSEFSVSNQYGILPTYIIGAFMFILLIKLFRH